MNEINQINNDNKNIIYSIDSRQRHVLENYIDKSNTNLKGLFQKEEILHFLFKNIEEGKYDFSQDNPDKDSPLTEEEINLKKDQFCRELKEIFDSISPEIFEKYNNKIGRATIKITEEINKRTKPIDKDPLIRKIEIKKINSDNNNKNKIKYNELNEIKDLIQSTIFLSKFYNEELNNSNNLLSRDLEQFYNDKSNIEIVNNVNGEEKKAKDDDVIQRVINIKEKKGRDFINETKKYISEMINRQNDLKNKISNLVNEFSILKEQQEDFKKYCHEDNSIFRNINECDFYE